MTFCRFLLCVTTALFIVTSCQNNSSNKQTNPSTHVLQSSTIELTNGWARPASKGGNSAAYLHIFNGRSSRDTLVGIQSEVTKKAQIHESYEDNGMAGMRPARPLSIAPDSTLQLQPGGFHIMLMNLNRELAEGDSVLITFNFAEAGSKRVAFPIKLSN